MKKLSEKNTKPYGGVMILIKEDIAPYFTHYKNKKKRFIIIKTVKNKRNKKEQKLIKKNLSIANVYAPTGSMALTNNFYNNGIEDLMKEVKKHGKSYIIGGDFNATINRNMDRWSDFSINTNEKEFKSFNKWIKKYNIKDIWRENNKDVKQYTWNKNFKDENGNQKIVR